MKFWDGFTTGFLTGPVVLLLLLQYFHALHVYGTGRIICIW